ncbi:MFS transporter [Streptomyces sp. AV19]|uniref:MFS transporter n=1 Tax=Streptomyces sp. AV19 TaxID=2793068 RepID=UPI0018FE8F9C|nr:MFS transporter [Streptomyces sp. AV19]MBH1932805.1 MFS transporter [Streptomyces sp. AV19]MDG4531470.1 MFS transporter [Streptomyces sp. AV19]
MRKVLLLALGSFALGLDAYVMAGLLPAIADDTGTTVALAGQLVTAFTLAYAVSAPLFASLLAGRRPRAALTGALAVFTVANGLTALAPTFGLLLAARVAAGAGAGLYAALSTAAAAAMVPAARRGRALALIMGGMSTGTVLGVPLGVLLAGHTGWRATLWLLTALGAVSLAGLLVLLPPLPPQHRASVRDRLAAVADRRVAPVVGVSFLAAVASLGLYTYLAPVLAAAGGVHGVTPYLWAWGLGGVLGSAAAGPLVDRTGRAPRLVAVVLALIVAAQALLPALAPHAVAAGLALLVWGAGGWALQVPQQHRLLELRPDRGPVVLALNSSALYLGSAVGSALGGAALSAGLAPRALPLAAAAVAALGLAGHAFATSRPRRDDGPRPTPALPSTLGDHEHS